MHGSHSAMATMFLYSTLLYFRLFSKEVNGAWQPFSRGNHVPIFHCSYILGCFSKEVNGAWQPFSRGNHVPIFHAPIF